MKPLLRRRAQAVASMARYRANKKALGLCREAGCTAPHTPGFVSCFACRKKEAQRRQRAVQEATAGGLCYACCLEKPAPGNRRCPGCIERQARWNRQSRARKKTSV